jgi:hypothetical protein
MKHRLNPILVIALLAGVLMWFLLPSHSVPELVRARTQASRTGSASGPVKTAAAPAPAAEPVTTEDTPGLRQDPPAPDPGSAVPVKPRRPQITALAPLPSDPESGPSLPPATVMENVRSAFRQYSSRFGGNPVGTNPEITAALNGNNPRQVVFLKPEDGLRVNERGELVDSWGTPLFFHQLSRTEMEIHSAGPDRKMWTADDLVIR